ncbi:MAG: hypothetical protein AM325_001675 [Candidatus Thorarchaeota archaeon SMTZ1-45]|nr:MAG: hypothetical protein AM325_03485 [Candidatus Thorarchaeota archaeon SMTZ1-45]
MSDPRDVQAPSTVEAIRMASASVLGTSTGLGYSIGSAIGAGSMLEQHSASVSMNIVPLVFTIRDTLMSSEGLEILSIEWDLDRTPGSDVLPDQLVVAGGSEGGVGSHVCVLSWEKGVVDPFKINEYMKAVSKKISDVESAVINNELNYELEGISVITKFTDRLNSVLFVDMLDRRFQGSWDSLQVKPDHVDVDLVAKLEVVDDFTLLPPGMKIRGRKSLEFKLPNEPDDRLVAHFKHRVLTPSAIEALTKVVPETGQSLLNEINYYAYAVEESELVGGVVKALIEFLGKSEVSLSEIETLRPRIGEFVKILGDSINALEHIVEEHLSSGKTLTIEDHKSSLTSGVSTNSDVSSGTKNNLAICIIDGIMNSVSREFRGAREIRAWELKGTMRYVIAYAKRVLQYFSKELNQYLVTNAAKKAFFTALQEFKKETLQEDIGPTDLTLFDLFYAEIQAQLNAAFSKEAFKGTKYEDFKQLMDLVTRQLIESFKKIDIWNLIGFENVAEIAKREIAIKYAVPDSEDLTEHGEALMKLLNEFQDLVSDIIPDVADTLLSKPLIRRIIDKMLTEQASLVEELEAAVEGAGERADEWKKEAIEWVESFKTTLDDSMTKSESLLKLLNSIHEIVGETVTPSAMVNRAKLEADQREQEYQAEIQEWERTCHIIEQENVAIREHNVKREKLLDQKTQQFENQMREYELALNDYMAQMERYRAIQDAESITHGETDQTLAPPPMEPTKPLPIDAELHEIRTQYPVKEEKSIPPKPEPDPSLKYYVELRDLLQSKLDHLKEREKDMATTFGKRVLRLQAEGIGAAAMIGLDLGDEFIEYLMGSKVRGLGKSLPRITRMYLRDPKVDDLLYLVTFERRADELTVSVGNTFLR